MAMKMVLNDEQRKLVEDNHALIIGYASKHNLDIDDWYDILALALCEAAFYYDESKGYLFSTFAFKCMNGDVYKEMVSKTKKIENISEIVSINFENCDDDGNWYDFSDLIPDMNQDTEGYVVSKITVDNLNKQFDEKSKKIINLLLSGCTQSAIARRMGVSRQRCSAMVNQIREQYNSLLLQEG